jgi:predicted TIM-barrel fold metal-dependent hydrolase
MYDGPIINMHTHLRLSDDLPARVANWRKWNLYKAVCLSVNDRWRSQGYCVNRDFPALMKRYPDIIVGFAGVNLIEGQMDTPDMLNRYREQGYAGLKFEDNTRPYNHDIYWPLYARAEELGLPILFHTGWLSPLIAPECNYDARDRIDSENMRPYLLDRVARAFPRLNLIGAHLGHPHCHEAIAVSAHPNVYYDFSGGSGAKPWVRAIAAALSPPLPGSDMADPEENPALGLFERKLLFATDNPEPDVWVPASEWIMDTLRIPAAIRERFYHKTAAAILGIAP